MITFALSAANSNYSCHQCHTPFVYPAFSSSSALVSPSKSVSSSNFSSDSSPPISAGVAGTAHILQHNNTIQTPFCTEAHTSDSYPGKIENVYVPQSIIRPATQQVLPFSCDPHSPGTPQGFPVRPAVWKETRYDMYVPERRFETSYERCSADIPVQQTTINSSDPDLKVGQRVWIFRPHALPAEIIKKERNPLLYGPSVFQLYTVHFIEGGNNRYETVCPALGHILPDSQLVREHLRSLGYLKDTDQNVLEAACTLVSLSVPKFAIIQ